MYTRCETRVTRRLPLPSPVSRFGIVAKNAINKKSIDINGLKSVIYDRGDFFSYKTKFLNG